MINSLNNRETVLLLHIFWEDFNSQCFSIEVIDANLKGSLQIYNYGELDNQSMEYYKLEQRNMSVSNHMTMKTWSYRIVATCWLCY